MQAASDADIWDYAAQHNLTIVTNDSDFRQRSFLYRHPPKVIWLAVGKCSTSVIERLLRQRLLQVAEFIADVEKALRI